MHAAAPLDTRIEHDRRTSARLNIAQQSTLRDSAHRPYNVHVIDLSTTGFRVETPLVLAIGAAVSVGLPGSGTATAHVVRRAAGGYACAFATPLDHQTLASAFNTEVVASIAPRDAVSLDDDEDDVQRWPVPARIAIIVGASLTGWGAILFAVSRFL